jgi:hypothetical protein
MGLTGESTRIGWGIIEKLMGWDSFACSQVNVPELFTH